MWLVKLTIINSVVCPVCGCLCDDIELTVEDGKIIKNEPNCAYGNSPDEMFLAWINNKSTPYLCSTLFNTRALKRIGGLKSKNNLF